MEYFTTKDMCKSLGLKKASISYRIRKLKVKPDYITNRTGFYRENSFVKISNFNIIPRVRINKPKENEFPEVIYITQTFLIIQSKINFME